MFYGQNGGPPGIGTVRTATPNTFLVNDRGLEYLEGGRYIDSAAYDWSNTSDSSQLTNGLIMGKVTATGRYLPTVLGVTTASVASGATSFNIGAAAATALAARVGATGTASLLAPPTAAGTVAVLAVTYSAVNTSTGALTVSALSAAAVIGSILIATDGSGTPKGLLDNDGYPLSVTNQFGTRQHTQMPRLAVSAHVFSAKVPHLLSGDASAIAYLKAQLNSNGRHFIFDDEY